MSLHARLIEQMEEIADRLDAENDGRRYFHNVYLNTTRAVMAEVEADGFVDSAWAERWGVAFADLYLDALRAWDDGGNPSKPWRIAFEAARDLDTTPLRHTLLGINAHVNYDLPQAFLAVITDAEFDDPETMSKRASDHAHIDSILASRVRSEDKNLARVEQRGDRTMADRLLLPFNRVGTKRFLKEGRRKVWSNTNVLAQARRRGPDAYAADLVRLEDLSGQRVADLVTPRFVLLALARHGFGVELAP
ncbi:MAG: DUF5995 family protein [Actinomycetota bacterium]